MHVFGDQAANRKPYLTNKASVIRNYKSGLSVLSKKNVALLTLQSLVYLPLLVFFTKSTVVILAMVTVCGLIYVRSLPRFRPVKNWVFLLLASAISAAWSIAPDQSLERAAKFSLLVITIAGLIHVVSNWSPGDRRFLLELGLKGGGLP